MQGNMHGLISKYTLGEVSRKAYIKTPVGKTTSSLFLALHSTPFSSRSDTLQSYFSSQAVLLIQYPVFFGPNRDILGPTDLLQSIKHQGLISGGNRSRRDLLQHLDFEI